MFVRRLVSGVRSSCEASFTSWRWERMALSSESSIVLKVSASRLSSSRPSTGMRSPRLRVSATVCASKKWGRENKAAAKRDLRVI